jgi:hypothetical protein
LFKLLLGNVRQKLYSHCLTGFGFPGMQQRSYRF